MKCIVSKDITKETYENLLKFTKDIILIQKVNSLYQGISSHADIQCFPLENNCVVVHPQICAKTVDTFRKHKIKVVFGDKKLAEEYPHNIAYNAAIVGNKVLHNFAYTDDVLRQELNQNGYEFISINQGYSKCSILTVDEKSIITSDAGIAKKATEYDIEVLLINKGNIELPGLNYGFIGGASGLIKREGIVVFNGNIEFHPDFSRIVEFLQQRGMTYICLSQGKLLDIGSIFFMP